MKRSLRKLKTTTAMTTTLKISPISEGVNKALRYIDERRKGNLKSLRTSFKKLNHALLEGID
jgi:hypothetical protein